MTDSQVSEIEQLRKRISQLEFDIDHVEKHDQLTGLLNRSAFVSEVDQCLLRYDQNKTRGTMIELSIRDLPRVTGSLGRHASDYAISALAARLNMMRHEDSLCCRLDYWSFAIFIPRVSDPLDALTTAKSIMENLSKPIDWIDRKISVELAAGVALTSDQTTDAMELLQHAGLALKSTGDKGGPGYSFFNPTLAQNAKRKADVLLALQDLIDKQMMQLNYQPFFDATSGDLVGFEALMRMDHPDLGSVSPVEFIPAAEESGLIGKLGAWALAEACRVAAGWPSHLTVAVNISPEQFYGGTLLTDVHNALELSSFPAYRLELEVTESIMLKDSDMVMSQLSALREMGCAIVLDDFGTGYSSLSYLWKFPFSKLKIDKSFVQALESTPLVRGMLKSIIDLSRNLGLKITAEGIEQQHHVETLRGFKCDFFQGYLSGRPASAVDIAAIIIKNYAEQLRIIPIKETTSTNPSATLRVAQ